jgi:hypothetical protein
LFAKVGDFFKKGGAKVRIAFKVADLQTNLSNRDFDLLDLKTISSRNRKSKSQKVESYCTKQDNLTVL